jgi:hypothetical protein
MNRHEEFLKAYADYPSQDNEGYVPDRGGFKAGFGAAWERLAAEVQTLKQDVSHWKHEASVAKEAANVFREVSAGYKTKLEQTIADKNKFDEETRAYLARLDETEDKLDCTRKALESLTNAALAGLTPLKSQVTAGFDALAKLDAPAWVGPDTSALPSVYGMGVVKAGNAAVPAYVPGTHPRYYNREEAVSFFIEGAQWLSDKLHAEKTSTKGD